uniref:Uncharacterized protein n=1 Tax=Colobus angolensis palliatus TaxID=336983 RepID=A0A2K5KEI1_COLAP
VVGGCLGGAHPSKIWLTGLSAWFFPSMILLPGPPQGYRKAKSSPEPIMSNLLTEGTAGSMVPPGLVSACGSPRFLSAFLNASRKDRSGMPTR